MSWKLTAGRLLDAWRQYPETRERAARVASGAPIFVTGTHRSGTTWFAQMLAASGVWYFHEPFSPKKKRWSRSFIYRRPDSTSDDVDSVMTAVLGYRFREALQMPNSDHPWMPLRLLPHRMSRVMVKDPLACLLTAYITKRFACQSLIVFRHPAGFVSSVCRLGWPRAEFLRQFLDDQLLMTDHLAAYRELLERHASEDSVASAAVLHGALNRVLWNFVEGGCGRSIVFEEACADPIGFFVELFEQLGLPYDERVRAEHERLCFGPSRPVGAYRTHAIARNSLASATSWRSQLSASEINDVRSIWNAFGVPLYRNDAVWRVSAPDGADGSGSQPHD